MNKQLSIASGSFYDAEVLATDVKYLQGRMPYLGQTIEMDDGRKFVYVSSVTALTIGQLAGTDSAALAAVLENACTAAAIGATQITVATTGATMFGGAAGVLAADAMKDGFIGFGQHTAAGAMYKVKSNTAGTATASVTFTLYDPLHTAIDTTTDIFLVAPMHRKVIVNTASTNPTGVCLRTITGTSEYFFWVQTWGPAMVVGTGTVGLPVEAQAAGAVKVQTENDEINLVGTCLVTSAVTQVPVYLRIS